MDPDRTAPRNGARVPSVEGYQDLRKLTVGGFSTVYTARQTHFDRVVALKVLNIDLTEPSAARQFARERQTLGRLSNHPNIVTVFDGGTTSDGRPYIAMRYYRHGSLADWVGRRGPLAASEVVAVGATLAKALQTAHRFGVVHRDVKPENVLISDDGDVVLSDFGTAAVSDTGSTVSMPAHTPVHCPPEVLDGASYDTRADVYAFGSTLHTLLSGSPPFAPRPGEGPATALRRILVGDAPDLADDVPVSLRTLVGRMIATDPDARPTVDELTDGFASLTSVLGTTLLPVTADTSTTVPRGARPGDVPAGSGRTENRGPADDTSADHDSSADHDNSADTDEDTADDWPRPNPAENPSGSPTTARSRITDAPAPPPAGRRGARRIALVAGLAILVIGAASGSWYVIEGRPKPPQSIVTAGNETLVPPTTTAPAATGTDTATPSPTSSPTPSPTLSPPSTPTPSITVTPPRTVTTSPTPTPDRPVTRPIAPAPPPDPHDELIARLDPDNLDIDTCRASPDSESKHNATTAVVCETAVDTSKVVVLKFAGSNSYDAFFEEREAHVTRTGECEDGYEEYSYWTNGGVRRGPLTCTDTENDKFKISWGFDDYNIAGIKDGAETNISGLYSWWEDNAYFLRR